MPRFSTDIRAMWQVVEKMSDMSLKVEMWSDWTDMQYWYCQIDDGKMFEEYTLPEAVCKAAVEAVKKYAKG